MRTLTTNSEGQSAESLTPFMRQWTAAKNEHPDTLLFFRMGDFYELFYDDAITAARELQITLTARDRERAIPMCGVPYHAAEGYLQRLLRKGFRIAICEQMEDPKLTKKIVRREVTRVLTPGTAIDNNLDQAQNNFLAAFHEDASTAAIALLDLSTGDFRTAEFTGPAAHNQALDELLKAQPSELLLPANAPENFAAEIDRTGDRVAARTRIDDWVWTRDYAVPLVERKLGVKSLEGFGLSGHPCAAIAAGVILHYVQTTQKLDALHLDSLRFVDGWSGNVRILNFCAGLVEHVVNARSCPGPHAEIHVIDESERIKPKNSRVHPTVNRNIRSIELQGLAIACGHAGKLRPSSRRLNCARFFCCQGLSANEGCNRDKENGTNDRGEFNRNSVHLHVLTLSLGSVRRSILGQGCRCEELDARSGPGKPAISRFHRGVQFLMKADRDFSLRSLVE